MTKLSPAAQDIVDAMGISEDSSLLIAARGIASVALRSAADHLNHDWSTFNCIDALYEIASELEGRNTPDKLDLNIF